MHDVSTKNVVPVRTENLLSAGSKTVERKWTCHGLFRIVFSFHGLAFSSQEKKSLDYSCDAPNALTQPTGNLKTTETDPLHQKSKYEDKQFCILRASLNCPIKI